MAYLGRKGQTAPLTSGDIPDGIIVAADLAPNSVDSDQYVDGSIDNAHLADDAVGTDELANDVVINTSGSITSTSATGILNTVGGTSARLLSYPGNAGSVGTSTNHKFVVQTNATDRMTIDTSGDISMAGSMSVGSHLHIATSAFSAARRLSSSSSDSTPITLYWGDLTVTTSSDVRLKDNIIDTEINGLEKLNQLAVKDFTWNDPSDKGYNNRNVRGKWTGLIAQEVIDILPFCVHAPRDKETLETLPDAVDEEDGETIIPWRMEFGYMVPVLIKAIQELSAKVTALETANTALEARVLALESA